MPILKKLAPIEDETGELVEYSDPTPEDLIPQPQTYRLGPGDVLRVTLWDLVTPGLAEDREATVDARGYIELPQLGRIYVDDMTNEDAQAAIAEQMRRLVANPLVSVAPLSQRKSTYSLIGAVTSPGPYFIPKPDFRLLEAITTGGQFDQSIPEVYIIRRVSLADPRPMTPAPSSPGLPSTQPTTAPGQEPGKSVIDIIDDITAPPAGGASPGAMASAGDRPRTRQPEVREPAVDLPEEDAPRRQGGTTAGSDWMYWEGRWVKAPAAQRAGGGRSAEDMTAQRIIRVSLDELMTGKQSVNIVIRPGDVIRLPSPPSGLVYVTGAVARPGPYGIPSAGAFTLMRALDSAGGLSGLAKPERVDITRMIGRDRQATIMVDARAISEQTQPDILIKPNDRINVGTSFWALPLAVVRSGFRMSYGFGFLLDRNFGNDVFGAPPSNEN